MKYSVVCPLKISKINDSNSFLKWNLCLSSGRFVVICSLSRNAYLGYITLWIVALSSNVVDSKSNFHFSKNKWLW